MSQNKKDRRAGDVAQSQGLKFNSQYVSKLLPSRSGEQQDVPKDATGHIGHSGCPQPWTLFCMLSRRQQAFLESLAGCFLGRAFQKKHLRRLALAPGWEPRLHPGPPSLNLGSASEQRGARSLDPTWPCPAMSFAWPFPGSLGNRLLLVSQLKIATPTKPPQPGPLLLHSA